MTPDLSPTPGPRLDGSSVNFFSEINRRRVHYIVGGPSIFQTPEGGGRDPRVGTPSQGEAALGGERPRSSPQDALDVGARHCHQGTQSRHRLKVVHGHAQEHADGPKDRAVHHHPDGRLLRDDVDEEEEERLSHGCTGLQAY